MTAPIDHPRPGAWVTSTETDLETLGAILTERTRQVRKWGDRSAFDGSSLPDGTGAPGADRAAAVAKTVTEQMARAGVLTWAQILREEHLEALAETDPEAIERELVQVAAVAVAWIRDLRSRREVASS